MQLHMPHLRHSDANWQAWARGIAIVFGMIAAPVALALTWLLVVRGLLS